VTLKVAQTKDGFVAYKDGSCPEITSQKSFQEVHKMRSWYDAVLIGMRTAVIDNPKLTVRFVKGRQPFRIILDAKAELTNKINTLNVFNDENIDSTIWVIGDNIQTPKIPNIKIIKAPLENETKIHLPSLLKLLAEQNIASIMVEGGPAIWESFIQDKLVDKLIILTSPKKFEEGIPAFKKGIMENITSIRNYQEEFGADSMNCSIFNLY